MGSMYVSDGLVCNRFFTRAFAASKNLVENAKRNPVLHRYREPRATVAYGTTGILAFLDRYAEMYGQNMPHQKAIDFYMRNKQGSLEYKSSVRDRKDRRVNLFRVSTGFHKLQTDYCSGGATPHGTIGGGKFFFAVRECSDAFPFFYLTWEATVDDEAIDITSQISHVGSRDAYVAAAVGSEGGDKHALIACVSTPRVRSSRLAAKKPLVIGAGDLIVGGPGFEKRWLGFTPAAIPCDDDKEDDADEGEDIADDGAGD